jgi:hypothetical protein
LRALAISLVNIAGGVQRGFPLWLSRDFDEVRTKLWALKKPMQEKLINVGLLVEIVTYTSNDCNTLYIYLV